MFDPTTELGNTHVHEFDPIGSANDRFDSYGVVNFGAKARKMVQDYENSRNLNHGGVQFRAVNSEDESGICSPPLWRHSPPRSPDHPQQLQNNFRHLSPTSRAQTIARGHWELMEMVKNMPESSYELSLKDLVEQHRLQGQEQEEPLVEERSFENDEMSNQMKRQENVKKNENRVKAMRSGSHNKYEISSQMANVKRQESAKKNEKKVNMMISGSHIKNDISSQMANVNRQESAKKNEKKVNVMRSGSHIKNEISSQMANVKRQESAKKNEKKVTMMRNESHIDNRGMFLKMGFPIPLRRKKKKKTNPFAKVSPKPDEPEKPLKDVEKDWWNAIRSPGSDESESVGISSSSGSKGSSGSSGSSRRSHSNSGRKKNSCLRCWSPLFQSKKSKSAK